MKAGKGARMSRQKRLTNPATKLPDHLIPQAMSSILLPELSGQAFITVKGYYIHSPIFFAGELKDVFAQPTPPHYPIQYGYIKD